MKIKIGALSLEDDLERVIAVKESLNNNTRLMVDANQAYDLRTAKYLSDKLYDIGIYFFESKIVLYFEDFLLSQYILYLFYHF